MKTLATGNESQTPMLASALIQGKLRAFSREQQR